MRTLEGMCPEYSLVQVHNSCNYSCPCFNPHSLKLNMKLHDICCGDILLFNSYGCTNPILEGCDDLRESDKLRGDELSGHDYTPPTHIELYVPLNLIH